MSRPDPRQAAAQRAAASSAMAGAVDLSALKARSDAANRPQPPGGGGGGTTGGAGASQYVIEASEANFQDVVERSVQVPVVIELWASRYPREEQVSSELERLATNGGGAWVLARVDIDQAPRIAQAFGVQQVPMIVIVAGGQPVDAVNGAMPDAQAAQWVQSLLDALRDRMPAIAEGEKRAAAGGDGDAEPEEEPEDPRFTAAEDALEAGDYAAAEAAYQAILDSEPANEQATAAIAQVRFLARAEQADPTAIERADAAPDDVDLQIAAADAEMAADRVEDAFGRLVATVGRTGGDDRDRVREHLVGLFELFPGDDPRVTTARRALARALF